MYIYDYGDDESTVCTTATRLTSSQAASAVKRRRHRWRCRELVLLAFAQRLQYALALGAFTYLGSRQFAHDTAKRRRDFTLARRRRPRARVVTKRDAVPRA